MTTADSVHSSLMSIVIRGGWRYACTEEKLYAFRRESSGYEKAVEELISSM